MKFGKYYFCIVLAFYLFSLISSKVNIKNLKNSGKKINELGETFTLEHTKPTLAIQTAKAGVPNKEEDYEDYANPITVNKLPDEVRKPSVGPLEAVNEIPTQHDYYDGSLRLNSVKIKCTIFTTKSDCIQNSFCGWCGSSNSCMLAKNISADTKCVTSAMIHSQPYPNWNPQVRTINEQVGGVSMHVVSNVTSR